MIDTYLSQSNITTYTVRVSKCFSCPRTFTIKGLRLPAHLESTARAMEAESASLAARKLAGKIQRSQAANQTAEEYSDTDSSQLDMDSTDGGETPARKPRSGGTAKQRWLAQRRRIRSALTMQRRRGKRNLEMTGSLQHAPLVPRGI